MGTMIQAHKLDEADFRGERFQDWPQRPARATTTCSTSPSRRSSRPSTAQYLEAGADIIETNTFNSTAISLADYELEGLARELNLAGARIARAAADAVMAAHPGRVCFVAGALGPTSKTASLSPDVNNPGLPGRHLRPAGRRPTASRPAACWRAAWTCCWSKRSSTRSTPRPPCSPSSKCFEDTGRRVPVMVSVTITDLQRAHPVRPDRRGLLEFDLPRPAAERRHQLRPRAQGDAAVHRGTVGPRATSPSAPIPTPACPTLLPTGFPETPESLAPQLQEWAANGWLKSSAAAAAPRRPTSGPSPRRCAACRRACRPSVEPVTAPERAGAADHSPGDQLRQHRRAHQRDRLAQVRQAHPGRRLRGRARHRPAAGRERRPDHRRQHGRGHARLARRP